MTYYRWHDAVTRRCRQLYPQIESQLRRLSPSISHFPLYLSPPLSLSPLSFSPSISHFPLYLSPPLSLTSLSIFLPLYLSLPSLTFSPSISPSATLFLWFSLSPSLSPSLSTSLSPSISPPFLPFTFRREIIRAHFARGFLSFTLNKFKQHFQELRLILFLIADHQSSCSTQQSMERCTAKAHL